MLRGIRISIHKALASLDYRPNARSQEQKDFNPQGSREPRPFLFVSFLLLCYFNPQGSREPRRCITVMQRIGLDIFQSTRLSRASTILLIPGFVGGLISIHKALASLDRAEIKILGQPFFISIHKALASLDLIRGEKQLCIAAISIHKALASLDRTPCPGRGHGSDFNPQGSREPRPQFIQRSKV